MLDIDTVPRHMTNHKMPVDFATYLLSSSPPATNIELLSYAFSPAAARNWSQGLHQNENGTLNVSLDTTKIPKQVKKKLIKPIIINKSEDLLSDGDCDSSRSSSRCVTPTSPCSPGKSGKKVSFADHKGLALATVKFMTEPSDQPPRLGQEIINSITKGAKAAVTGLPPFKLNFTQPASDYLAFREKVNNNCVSLENVILRDYNVLGTIKVKNVSFDKHVFIRCTFDSWETSNDFEAKYVAPVGNNGGQNVDTFSFEFDIATQVDTHKKIEFCVCFETPTNQYWDSNNGENYNILPTNFNLHSGQSQSSSSHSHESLSNEISSWTEYGCWHHVDTTSPYY